MLDALSYVLIVRKELLLFLKKQGNSMSAQTTWKHNFKNNKYEEL